MLLFAAPLWRDVAVKQTAALFVGNVLADR